jgi:hypothetical protein
MAYYNYTFQVMTGWASCTKPVFPLGYFSSAVAKLAGGVGWLSNQFFLCPTLGRRDHMLLF